MMFNSEKNSKHSFIPYVLTTGLLVGISACNSSDPEVNIDYSNLKLAPISGKTLTTTDSLDFSRYLKNGLRLRLGRASGSGVELAADASIANNTLQQSQFSTTNTHEIGVDEDDRLKFDGEYLYIAEDGYFPTSSQTGVPAIRILHTDSTNAHAEEVARIERNDELAVSGLYLHEEETEKQLLSIAKTSFYYATALVEPDWQWSSGKTEIKLTDISDPVNPVESWKLEIEGNLEGSRKIGNKLYLITRYIPDIEELDYGAETVEKQVQNEKLILQTPISDLLPHYQANDGAIRSLVSADDCLLASDYDHLDGYADVITLTSVDLTARQVESSVCLNANVQGIYSSIDNLYIGASGLVDWASISSGTSVHKFALNEVGVSYRASGFVDGELGWQDPSFRMSEFEDDFRIVTTEWTGSGPIHRLTVMREGNDNLLEQISQIPNESQPAPIGKPGEQIFAVRFVDNKAYVITFEQIDPLYQIDLTDPANPRIESELEMPGVARYLHPISDGWLLGVGHEVENGLMQGVKVELYDIRNPETPLIVDTHVIGERGSWSEAHYNLKAFSLLATGNDSLQVAFPVSRYAFDPQLQYRRWQDTSLHMFAIGGLETGNLELTLQGHMVSESSENTDYPSHWEGGRSLLQTDSIFYLQGNRLIGSLQADFDNITGPF